MTNKTSYILVGIALLAFWLVVGTAIYLIFK
jgi:hypothetical protein